MSGKNSEFIQFVFYMSLKVNLGAFLFLTIIKGELKMNSTTCLRKPATIRLNRAELQEKIDRIFEEAGHQNECIVNIYKIVLPHWDNIYRLIGYPTVGCGMWRYVCRKFIDFDAKHHPECVCGIWINSGFSSSADLGDWEIDMSKCKVTYN
jgi:hypothetical protein